ncbi:MAG: hypothetical protein ACI4J7_03915 [Ruminiclostridium sp.]
MTDNRETPYFGFLEGVHPTLKEFALQFLTEKRSNKTAGFCIASDIVEEIVRRDGDLYTAAEARQTAPFEIKHDDVFFASFGYLEGEPKPPNPAYSQRDWCVLSVYEYSYGMYLKKLIAEGKLTKEELESAGRQDCENS